MNRLIGALLVLCPLILSAESELVCEKAEYHGDTVKVSGNVVLDHSIGTLKCQSAELVPSDSGERFSQIELEGDVDLALRDGGRLMAGAALIDFLRLEGRFWGNARQPFVIYSDQLSPSQNSTPIVIKGGKMWLTLSAGSSPDVTDCVFEEQVTVNLQNGTQAASDRVVYHRLEKQGKRTLSGVMTLLPEGTPGVCQISAPNGDLVQAKRISVHTLDETVEFDDSKGALYLTSRPGGKKERLDFSCGSLLWRHSQGALTLQDQVVLHQPGLGQLRSAKKVEVRHKQMQGDGLEIESITSFGETEFVYSDPESFERHLIKCHGKFHVDHRLGQVFLTSPSGEHGVHPDNQVSLHDRYGQIFADSVRIDYGMDRQGSVERINLLGNVYIKNMKERGSAGEQHALADRVEYSPVTQLMTMRSDGEGRVLFFDEENSLRMSAPALNVKRDEISGQESVRAEGDVRFTFYPHEVEAWQRCRGRMQAAKSLAESSK